MINFAEISVYEQLRTIRTTNIFIGPHGAGEYFPSIYEAATLNNYNMYLFIVVGLTHVLFLPKGGILIEMHNTVQYPYPPFVPFAFSFTQARFHLRKPRLQPIVIKALLKWQE